MFISGVTSWGFFVELDNTIEGMVSINSLLDDFYVFDEEVISLRGNIPDEFSHWVKR